MIRMILAISTMMMLTRHKIVLSVKENRNYDGGKANDDARLHKYHW